MRGIHRDMDGTVIGGYAPDGTPLGNKRGQGGGASFSREMRQPPSKPAANAYDLNARQNLYKSMEQAGPEGISNEMRTKARSLGVNDEAFNGAASRIRANSAYSPQPTTAPAAVAPQAAPIPQAPAKTGAADNIFGGPTKVEQQIKSEGQSDWEKARSQRIAKQDATRAQGLNPQTGQAMGAGFDRKTAPPIATRKPQFGADIAKQNLADMGAVGAATDYFERKRLDVGMASAKKARRQYGDINA